MKYRLLALIVIVLSLTPTAAGASPPDAPVDRDRYETTDERVEEGASGARQLGRMIGTVVVPGLVAYLVFRNTRGRKETYPPNGTVAYYGQTPPPTMAPPHLYPPTQPTMTPPPGTYPPPPPPQP